MDFYVIDQPMNPNKEERVAVFIFSNNVHTRLCGAPNKSLAISNAIVMLNQLINNLRDYRKESNND